MSYTLAIEAGDWPDDSLLKMLIEKARNALADVLDADEARDLNEAPVTFLFTDDAAQKKLNSEWRDQDKTTNVLSFPTPYMPLPEGEVLPLGDISLAYETVEAEAALEEKPFDSHLSHLIIHGLLHLLGYDHEDDEEADQMEAIEIDALRALHIANPYQ